MRPDLDAVRAALNEIADPCARIAGMEIGLVDFGLVRDLVAGDDGGVRLTLAVTGPGCWYAPMFMAEARSRVSALPHVTAVDIVLDTTYDWSEARMSANARDRLANRRRLGERDPGGLKA